MQKRMPAPMRNAEGMEEGEGCGNLSKVSLFLSPVTSVMGCTVALPSSHPFNSGFQPSERIACVCPSLPSLVSPEGCLPSLPVTCDLFYGKENQLKFEGKGYSILKRFFTLVH